MGRVNCCSSPPPYPPFVSCILRWRCFRACLMKPASWSQNPWVTSAEPGTRYPKRPPASYARARTRCARSARPHPEASINDRQPSHRVSMLQTSEVLTTLADAAAVWLSSPGDVRPSSVQDVLESDDQQAQGSGGEGFNGQLGAANPGEMCRVSRRPGQHRHGEPQR